MVNANGQLGIQSSSQQFKEEIRDMGNVSSRLMMLRPVTFYYKPEFSQGPRTLQYGLIAEEVAKVYPELVQYSATGQPYAVRYHLTIPMLLNEIQKLDEKARSYEQEIAKQARQIAGLTSRLESLEKLMQQVQTMSREKTVAGEVSSQEQDQN
jgi:type I site-specific restriction endonuclease